MTRRKRAQPVKSEMTEATTDDRLRGLVAAARAHGSKFVIPTDMYQILREQAEAGDQLAIDCLEVCCVVHRIPITRKPA
jgi:hypothetical protein